jgi:methionine synthase I (cobalamin-dependent)
MWRTNYDGAMSTFLDALQAGTPLLMDGAMGTELQRAGVRPDECYELCNLTHPDWVLGIHQAYVDSGARCLLTNTFQANPASLDRHGLEAKLPEIGAAAVSLARAVASPDRFVLGSIGPLEHWDVATMGRIVEALDGVDGLLFETWSDVAALSRLLQAHERLWNPDELPVVVSFTYRRALQPGEPPTLPDGTDAETAARAAEEFGAAAVGVNCGRDMSMDQIIDVVGRYRRVTKLPLLARPNAGTPRRTGDGWIYPHSAEAMAGQLSALVDAGAILVGGCCGTTLAHIAAFRRVLKPS